MYRPTLTVGLIVAHCTLGAPATIAQFRSAPISNVSYDVTIDSATVTNRLIRVDMTFRADGTEPVILSLPAWTPGSYELDNFARHVVGFSARAGGGEIRWDKTDYDTWRVFPSGASDVTVSLDYRADTLDTGMAWTAPDFAFFNGTNVFLYPEGRPLDFPCRVRIHASPGWAVATGLTPSEAPLSYEAGSYHELVDMPTFVGRFDLDSAQVDGRWYRLATYPRGTLTGAARDTLWQQIHEMMPPMAAVFGETPWQTYTIEMVFPDGFPGGAALEHANSHLGIYNPQFIGNPLLASVVAHETFHAWNVKRLRPAQLVPYDYGRAQPTELLWVSEGITDYYADLALVRGGTVNAEAFYQTTGQKISTVTNTPPVALEDASLSTWIEPADGTAFVYYPKGSLAGFLLDILIRDASDNHASLDQVMRALYRSTYERGRGFSTEEWWRAVRTAAGGRTFEDFASRYVDGREPFPWDIVLPLAGLALVTDTARPARIGISTNQDDTGIQILRVTPGSSAADAGIEAGDYLLRVGDVEVTDQGFGAAFRQRYASSPAGAPLEYVVSRGGERMTLQGDLRFAEVVQFRLVEDEAASPKARRIRDGILSGTVAR